jgi:hypothetical protein
MAFYGFDGAEGSRSLTGLCSPSPYSAARIVGT